MSMSGRTGKETDEHRSDDDDGTHAGTDRHRTDDDDGADVGTDGQRTTTATTGQTRRDKRMDNDGDQTDTKGKIPRTSIKYNHQIQAPSTSTKYKA